MLDWAEISSDEEEYVEPEEEHAEKPKAPKNVNMFVAGPAPEGGYQHLLNQYFTRYGGYGEEGQYQSRGHRRGGYGHDHGYGGGHDYERGGYGDRRGGRRGGRGGRGGRDRDGEGFEGKPRVDMQQKTEQAIEALKKAQSPVELKLSRVPQELSIEAVAKDFSLSVKQNIPCSL